MIGMIWIINIAIGVIDFAIFLIISTILLRNYYATKTRMLKNLFTFSVLMMIYALSSVGSSIYLSSNYGIKVGAPLLIVNVISVAGFLLLYNVIRS